MKDEGNFFNGAASVDEAPARKPRLIAFIVVFLLLLVALGFAANYFLQAKNKKAMIASITPTVTQIPSDTPTATPVSTPSGTVKQTLTGTPSVTGSTKTSTTVEVLNGSGVAGVATKMATTLKSLGYTVSGTGNAPTFDYTNVVIEVQKTEPNLIKQLSTDLGKTYAIGSTSASLTNGTSTDAIVIVGK